MQPYSRQRPLPRPSAILGANNMLLPGKIRPNIVTSIALGIGAVFYLGLLFYRILAYGALPD
jgi:hypothetical protein